MAGSDGEQHCADWCSLQRGQCVHKAGVRAALRPDINHQVPADTFTSAIHRADRHLPYIVNSDTEGQVCGVLWLAVSELTGYLVRLSVRSDRLSMTLPESL